MGSRKWSDAAKYGGTGAAVGAGIGSLVGPVGTVVGGAVGAVGGGIAGLIGGSIADSNADDAEAAALESQKAEAKKAREEAYRNYMLDYADSLGPDDGRAGQRNYREGLQNLDNKAQQNQAGITAAYDKAGEFDPNSLVSLAQGVNATAKGFKGIGGPNAPSAPVQHDADLSGLAPVQYTPSTLQDPSLSAEVQDQFDADNLRPLRAGRRMGF